MSTRVPLALAASNEAGILVARGEVSDADAALFQSVR
jgi:hypothetical protein